MEIKPRIDEKDKNITTNIINYKGFITTIKEFIQKNISRYDEIDSVILFGSFATKTYNNESDIDLCVLFKKGINLKSEDIIFDKFLDLGKKLDKSIQCVFIIPEEINNLDRIFLENILAEGQLLYGTSNYYELFIKYLDLEPFQIITLNLRSLNNSTKMKLKRLLYGYKTNRKFSNKTYTYQKTGFVQELRGIKLGRGSFIIPEKHMPIIYENLKSYDIKFSSYRVWMQKI